MNQTSLYYFVVTAQELNMTRAAARLFISQQSLSEHIRKLERQYDAVFFDRKGRLTLTYQGERMLAYATRVLEAEQNLTAELRDAAGRSKERMSIGLTSTRGTVFLPEIFTEFHRTCPHVIVAVESGNYEYIERQYQLEKLQLYTGMTVNVRTSAPAEILYQDKLYFIVSRELLRRRLGQEAGAFVQAHADGVSIADACRFPIALPPNSSTLRITFDRVFSRTNLVPELVLETTDHDLLFDLCKNGVCGCYVSRELLYRKIKHKSQPEDVLIFPAADLKDLASFCIIYPGPSASESVREFVRCFRSVTDSALRNIEADLAALTRKEQDAR